MFRGRHVCSRSRYSTLTMIPFCQPSYKLQHEHVVPAILQTTVDHASIGVSTAPVSIDHGRPRRSTPRVRAAACQRQCQRKRNYIPVVQYNTTAWAQIPAHADPHRFLAAEAQIIVASLALESRRNFTCLPSVSGCLSLGHDDYKPCPVESDRCHARRTRLHRVFLSPCKLTPTRQVRTQADRH